MIFHGRPNSDSGSGGSDIPKLKEGHRDDLDHDVKMKYNSQPNTDYRENDRNVRSGRGREEDDSMGDGRDTARSRDRGRDGREDRNKNFERRNEKQKLDNEEWSVPPRQVRHQCSFQLLHGLSYLFHSIQSYPI